MGFDGKTLIHPSQVAVANAAFGPSPDDVDAARRVIAAMEAAAAAGAGVAVVGGRLVEAMHVADARALLVAHEAILAREGGAHSSSASDVTAAAPQTGAPAAAGR